jgi:hypothetical protein
MKKYKINFAKRLLNEGQDILSPAQKEHLMKTGKLSMCFY